MSSRARSNNLLLKWLLPLALKVKEPLSFLSESEQHSSNTSLMFGLRASAMVSAVTGSKRTLVAVLKKCAPGSSYSPLNPDQSKRGRSLDSLGDLFSNSPFFLSPYLICRKDVSDALRIYTTESIFVCQSFEVISHLPFNQILKFPGRPLENIF